jgi:hypothetical protein
MRTVRPASGTKRKLGHLSLTADAGVTEPADRVRAWETAYRQYGRASEAAATRLSSNDRAANSQMARASRAVADAWRSIAAVVDLPWWSLAAVESAAEAFEAQARDWETRDERSRLVSGGELDES